MRFERALRVAQVGVMAVCIGVPPIMFGLGSRSAAIDNRAPTPRPAVSGTKLLDTAITDQFDHFLNDAFPFRQQAVRADAQLARALGDSSNSEVEVGRDGWLFYAGARTQPCIDSNEEARLVDALDRVERVMTAIDKRITHVIAPDKASIFTNKLASEPTCTLQNAEVIPTLDTDATLVTAWTETRAAAAGENALYRRLDTHWTSLGAAPTASALVNSVSPDLWDIDALAVAYTTDAPGDLSYLLGRDDTEPETVLTAVPYTPPSTSNPLVVDGTTIDGAVHQTDWPGAIAERTVLLHDSFGIRLVPLVAPYFEDIVTIRGVSPRQESLQPTLAASDHIVREQVQREFYYDAVVNDLAAQFVVAFADDFDTVDLEVVCESTCVIAPVSPVTQSVESDFYAIATLRDGVTDAEVVVDGVTHQLTGSQPSFGLFLPARSDRIVVSDLQLVDWTGRSVTP